MEMMKSRRYQDCRPAAEVLRNTVTRPEADLKSSRHTKPGGWVELQEGDYNLYSDDGTYKKGSAVDEWIGNLFSCSRQMGKEPCPGLITERLMRDAGFLNVKRTIIKVPIGPWPKDRRLVWSCFRLGSRDISHKKGC